MTAPGPVPGAENPFVAAYQTRQFPNAHNGDPDINVFDALETPPASGVAAVAADRYDPAVGTPPFGAP